MNRNRKYKLWTLVQVLLVMVAFLLDLFVPACISHPGILARYAEHVIDVTAFLSLLVPWLCWFAYSEEAYLSKRLWLVGLFPFACAIGRMIFLCAMGDN